jgi:endoglycosylceramidase
MKLKNATLSQHLLLIFIIILLHAHNVRPRLDKIRIKGNAFVDESDRVVIFHGVNAVKKEAPWVPDSWNRTQIEYLKAWGFNVVRLGVMWAGLMPKKDYVNTTYLNEMVKIVDMLEEAGLYVIIDLHQDMLSSKL